MEKIFAIYPFRWQVVVGLRFVLIRAIKITNHQRIIPLMALFAISVTLIAVRSHRLSLVNSMKQLA